MIFKLKIRSLSNYIWLFFITGLYSYFSLKHCKAPVETAHFLEYGLLSFFLFKALNHNIKDKSIYLTATFFALLIGTFDEIIQWITPKRIWNFRDVGLNVISGGLFQLAMWKVIRPKIISEKINTKSLRMFSAVFSSCLIILGLCVSNTPNRVYNYTKRIHWLFFLQKEEPMSEFGYKYKDTEIGVFYSRLSPSILQKIDKQKGKEYAQIIDKSANKDYEKFIRKYNPISNPFMHELRVHIFRRDRYFENGNKTSNLNEKKEFHLVAYKENLILEKYFSRSSQNSVYRWDEDELEKVKILIDKDKSYESPVSANLSTGFSEKSIWTVIFTLISILIVINLYFVFKKPFHLPLIGKK